MPWRPVPETFDRSISIRSTLKYLNIRAGAFSEATCPTPWLPSSIRRDEHDSVDTTVEEFGSRHVHAAICEIAIFLRLLRNGQNDVPDLIDVEDNRRNPSRQG